MAAPILDRPTSNPRCIKRVKCEPSLTQIEKGARVFLDQECPILRTLNIKERRALAEEIYRAMVGNPPEKI